MALSENVKISLNIEVAESTQDLSVLNKTINELDKSLKTLNKDSKEYAQTEEAISKATKKQTTLSIDQVIETSKNAKSIRDLTKSMKELKASQDSVDKSSPQFKKLQNAINDTEGKLGDLNDQFKTFAGSGVERTKNSIGLLQEGFNNFDVDKIKIGFQGLGAAMKAVPIFLLIEGVRLLIDNFDEVVNFLGLGSEETNSFKNEQKDLEDQLAKTNKEVEDFVALLELQIKNLKDSKGPIGDIIALVKQKTQVETDNIDQQIDKVKNKIKSDEEQIKSSEKTLEQSKLTAASTINNINSTINAQESQLKSSLEQNKKELQSLEKLKADKTKITNEGNDEIEDLNEDAYQKWKTVNDLRIENIEDDKTRELEILKAKYEDEKREFNKNGISTNELTIKYKREQLDIVQKYVDKQKAINDKIKEEKKKADERGAQEEQKDIEDRKTAIIESYKSELLYLKDNDTKKLDLLVKQNSELLSVELDNLNLSEEQKAALRLKYANEELKIRKDFNSKKEEEDKKAAEKEKKEEEDKWKKKVELIQKYVAVASQILSGLSNVLNGISALQSQRDEQSISELQKTSDEKLKVIDESTNAEKEKIQTELDNGLISKEEADKKQQELEYQAALSKYEVEKATFDSTEKIKKAEFERNKKYQIANAIISGAVGAAQAFSGAMSLGPIAGPIVGGINAGLVVTSTVLQVAKIKEQKYEGGTAPAPPTKPSGGGANIAGGNDAGNGFNAPKFFGIGQTQLSTQNNDSMRPVVSVTEINEKNNNIEVAENRVIQKL